jgi:hypothetical protein
MVEEGPVVEVIGQAKEYEERTDGGCSGNDVSI